LAKKLTLMTKHEHKTDTVGTKTKLICLKETTVPNNWQEHLNIPEQKYSDMYKTMVENANDQIFIVQDEIVKFANTKACELLGYSKEELEGKDFREIIAPEDRGGAIRRFRLRMSGRSTRDTFEQVLLTRDGRKIPTEINASVFQYLGRRADLTYARDITEKKRILEELKESEGKYRELFENVKDVVYISNKEGKLLDINCYGVELFGYSNKEDMYKIDIGKQLYVNVSRREQFQKMISAKGYIKDFEVKLKKRDGSKIIALITSTEIKDKYGNILGYQGILRDITKKKQREEEAKNRSRELGILNRISSIVSRSLDLDKVLYRALEEMSKLIQADMGFFFLAKKGGKEFHFEGSYGCHDKLVEKTQKMSLIPKKLPGKPILLNSVSDNRFFFGENFFQESKHGSKLVVPLKARDKYLGIIILILKKKRDIPPEIIRLVQLSADQIIGALERAKLYSDIKEKEHKLEILSNTIINMQEEERKRISRELHDEIGQALTAVEIEIGLLKNTLPEKYQILGIFEKIKTLIDNTLINIRRISLDLRPVLLDEVGLRPALRWYVNDFSHRTGIDVTIRISGLKRRLDQKREIMIYRIVQECLTNVFKHSQATEAEMVLFVDGNQIKIDLQDNGKGFDSGQVINAKDDGGLGLFGIRERLKIINGDLEISSNPTRGTKISINIPCRTNTANQVLFNDEQNQSTLG